MDKTMISNKIIVQCTLARLRGNKRTFIRRTTVEVYMSYTTVKVTFAFETQESSRSSSSVIVEETFGSNCADYEKHQIEFTNLYLFFPSHGILLDSPPGYSIWLYHSSAIWNQASLCHIT